MYICEWLNQSIRKSYVREGEGTYIIIYSILPYCVMYITGLLSLATTYLLDQFPWLLKMIHRLRPGWYVPAFRNFKAVILDCMKDRREKAKAEQVFLALK